MNERQRKFLIGVGVVMISMLPFIPFYYQAGEGSRRGHCYSLIFSLPDYYYAVNIGCCLSSCLLLRRLVSSDGMS